MPCGALIMDLLHDVKILYTKLWFELRTRTQIRTNFGHASPPIYVLVKNFSTSKWLIDLRQQPKVKGFLETFPCSRLRKVINGSNVFDQFPISSLLLSMGELLENALFESFREFKTGSRALIKIENPFNLWRIVPSTNSQTPRLPLYAKMTQVLCKNGSFFGDNFIQKRSS